ncbi:hypothetical protein OsccyDRAFT_1168 [Leptolyngbyaceae cyanobacterium JSC-12]|nr:hypothetical protein OsccyDRAFT_1168 [Leptolyngbyaceae cyanobacterium JSC-12]
MGGRDCNQKLESDRTKTAPIKGLVFPRLTVGMLALLQDGLAIASLNLMAATLQPY